MDARDFSHLFQHSKNRKKERKQKRHLKKVVKKAFFAHKNVEDAVKSEYERKPKKVKTQKKRKKTGPKTLQSEVERFQDEAKKAHLERLREELDGDDKEIKFLMKKLGYNKRKTTAMPQIFEKEGLHLLWDLCEGNLSASAAELPKNDEDEPLFENPEDKAMEVDQEDEQSDQEMDDDAEQNDSESEEGSFDEESDQDSDQEDEPEKETLVEDIYGRTIDAKTGKIVKGVDTSKAQQKLEQLNEESELTEEKRQALTKSIRSIFNRLNQSTLVASVKSLEQLISSNSRNDVKQIFYEIFSKTITTQAALTDRLVIEFAGYLLLVHQLISAEVSAHFVEKFTLGYIDMLANEDQERNSLRNSTVLFAQIYNFKVIKAAFLIEIMDKLRSIETPIALNMLCELLIYTGITLKKRDGNALNAFILRLHEQFERMSKDKLEDDRISFLVEDLQTIKNAKLAKFTEKFDRSFLEHYQKVLKGLTKQIEKKESELGFSVDDILHIPERGRWWVLGSAFTRNSIHEMEKFDASTNASSKFDESLLKLAAKLQMNTETRREIFCTIMSATNINDAFEKLLKLGKNDHQGRELIYILIVCALHEREYNPFYANLIERFCEHKRTFQLTMQFAIWDRLKQMDTMKKHQRQNLAILTADLIWLETAQLTVLKVINFGMLDEATTVLLKRVMFRLLVKSNENALSQLFGRVLRESSKNELLTHGLQLFFEVVLKEEDFAEADELPIFKKRLSFVRDLLGIAE